MSEQTITDGNGTTITVNDYGTTWVTLANGSWSVSWTDANTGDSFHWSFDATDGSFRLEDIGNNDVVYLGWKPDPTATDGNADSDPDSNSDPNSSDESDPNSSDDSDPADSQNTSDTEEEQTGDDQSNSSTTGSEDPNPMDDGSGWGSQGFPPGFRYVGPGVAAADDPEGGFSSPQGFPPGLHHINPYSIDPTGGDAGGGGYSQGQAPPGVHRGPGVVMPNPEGGGPEGPAARVMRPAARGAALAALRSILAGGNNLG